MVPQSRHVGPNEASNRELCYACTFRADASRMNRTATGRAVKCLELHKASLPFHPLICPLAALRSLAFHFHPFESNRSHFLRNGSRSRSKAFFFSSSKGKQVRLLNSSLLPQPRCPRYGGTCLCWRKGTRRAAELPRCREQSAERSVPTTTDALEPRSTLTWRVCSRVFFLLLISDRQTRAQRQARQSPSVTR